MSTLARGLASAVMFLGGIYCMAQVLEVHERRRGSRRWQTGPKEAVERDKANVANRITLAQQHAMLAAKGVWKTDYEMTPMPPPPEHYPLLRGSELDEALVEMSRRDSVLTPEEASRRRRAAVRKSLESKRPTC